MKVNCPQWSDCGSPDGGRCGVGKYGGRPSAGICNLVCKLNPAPCGIGDAIANVLQTTRVAYVAKKILGEDCGCAKRQESANKAFPFK